MPHANRLRFHPTVLQTCSPVYANLETPARGECSSPKSPVPLLFATPCYPPSTELLSVGRTCAAPTPLPQQSVSLRWPVAESRGFDHSEACRLFRPIRLRDSISAAAPPPEVPPRPIDSKEFRREAPRHASFVHAGSAAVAASAAWYTGVSTNIFGQSPNERPILGCIGVGDRWRAVGGNALHFADCVAVCDVDASHVESAQKMVKDRQGKKGSETVVDGYEDYRKILDRKDVQVVTIVTPDHWHTKIAIEAMRAGKDVYCEKPLTLTIEEGKMICKVMKETNRVFQVGTQQRSEMGQRFIQAVALIRDGRIGQVKKVTCGINGAPTSRNSRFRRGAEGTELGHVAGSGSVRRLRLGRPRKRATRTAALPLRVPLVGTNTRAEK